jgi:hypothetical protein
MDTCDICARPLEGAALSGMHPECVAERLPRDVAVTMVSVLVLVLAPALAVWAS